jgi:hypothetical protein
VRRLPPFFKGGKGGFKCKSFKIPLNPPLEKGDFAVFPVMQSIRDQKNQPYFNAYGP